MLSSKYPRKKILFLITKSNWGGAQRHVYDIATTLDPSEFEAVVALGGNGQLQKKLEEKNIRTIAIPGLSRDISLMKEIKATKAIAQILRKEKPHVLHIHSSKAGALGTCLGRILNVPNVIFTAHGWAFNEDRPPWQKIVLKSIHWLTVRMSHTTIAVSHSVKAQMNWRGVAKKIVVIHPGRTIAHLKSKNEARGIIETNVIKNTHSLYQRHADFWIGTIAELHPIKQLHRAIDALAVLKTSFPSVRYIVIGSGECLHALQAQVERLQLQENVFFTGSVHEASRLLKAFDVFILPSASEAYGYVLLEAGLAQLPVIATNVGGIPEIITNNTTGILIPPHNTDALATALQSLIPNESLRTTLASHLHQSVIENTVENMTTKITKIYGATPRRSTNL